MRTEHFSTFFESLSDEPLARDSAERLEITYARLGRTLGLYPSERITVVLDTREHSADQAPRFVVGGRVRRSHSTTDREDVATA